MLNRKRKNYLVIHILKNEIPFVRIIKLDPNSGEIIYAMEKPDFKNMKDPNISISGAHVIQSEPWNNHYDHWISGAFLIKDFWSPEHDLPFPFQISGSELV